MTYKPYLSPTRNKWKACIRLGPDRVTLGWYETEEDARNAYIRAAHEIRDTGTLAKTYGQRYSSK